MVNTNRCKGCSLCIVACPKGVIALADKKVNVSGYPYIEAKTPDELTTKVGSLTNEINNIAISLRKKRGWLK